MNKVFDYYGNEEPLINLEISQRDLKRAVARQITQLMAVALGKLFNNANVRLRSRPSGPLSFFLFFVMFPKLNPLGLRQHASIRKKLSGLRYLEVNQRFLKPKVCSHANYNLVSSQ